MFPGEIPQPGSLHAPLSSVQWRRSQQERYRPDNIFACTVAALTALGEEPQVHQTGCGPDPSGRKEGRR